MGLVGTVPPCATVLNTVFWKAPLGTPFSPLILKATPQDSPVSLSIAQTAFAEDVTHSFGNVLGVEFTDKVSRGDSFTPTSTLQWTFSVIPTLASNSSSYIHLSKGHDMSVITGYFYSNGNDATATGTIGAYLNITTFTPKFLGISSVFGVACLNLDRSCPIRLSEAIYNNNSVLGLYFYGSLDAGKYYFNMSFAHVQ